MIKNLKPIFLFILSMLFIFTTKAQEYYNSDKWKEISKDSIGNDTLLSIANCFRSNYDTTSESTVVVFHSKGGQWFVAKYLYYPRKGTWVLLKKDYLGRFSSKFIRENILSTELALNKLISRNDSIRTIGGSYSIRAQIRIGKTPPICLDGFSSFGSGGINSLVGQGENIMILFTLYSFGNNLT